MLVLALAACTQPAGNPVAHVSTPTPSPTSSPDLPISTLSFSCRLPVYGNSADGTSAIADSFVDFPSGQLTADPKGKQGKYYDLAFDRWLPVPRQAVSPDGTRYAFVDPRQSSEIVIHTVDVATGADTVVHLRDSATGFNGEVEVFDYAPEGIYLTQGFEHIFPGVWLYNPRTRTVSKAADLEVPELSAGSGVFWYGAVNKVDSSPVASGSSAGILPDEVDRINLRTGAQALWLFRAGVAVSVLGVDLLGRPLIIALVPTPKLEGKGTGEDFYQHAQSELLLGLSTTAQRSVYKGKVVETLNGAIADSHGVWLGSSRGIYHYSDASGLQKVSDHAGTPANGCF